MRKGNNFGGVRSTNVDGLNRVVHVVFSNSYGDYPLEVVTPHAPRAARHATAVSPFQLSV